MTCCVAAICDDGASIVLVADKMIGAGYVESEPDVHKAIQIHRDWWVLFAGNDISPVFEITDSIRDEIERKRSLYVEDVEEAVEQAYENARLRRAIRPC
jgi:20S proteasome alpha/beta subunit